MVYDLNVSPTNMISKFFQLKKLFLDQIESTYMEKILHQLISLPFLTSLTIFMVDPVNNINTLYLQIFNLPTLKYCQLSLKEGLTRELLPMASNQHSSIEYLVINNIININRLINLLSYVPQLRRLTIHSLEESYHKQICPIMLNHLTHVSLTLKNINFHEFRQFIIDFCSTINVLRITIKHFIDSSYVDNKKWEELISSYIPNLRIFDIQYENYFNSIHSSRNDVLFNQAISNVLINKFTSSFWIERGWFFAQQNYQSNRTIFYSTNPYRRNTYTLCGKFEKKTCLNTCDNNLKSVRHVHIQNKKAMNKCKYYFPNVIALTINNNDTKSYNSFSTILRNIIPSKQLTKLIIECSQFSFIEILDLLCSMPNIHTLIFLSIPRFKHKFHIVKKSEKLQLLSNINTITDMTIIGSLKFEENQLFINSCQHLQHLIINTTIDDLEMDIRLLSNKYHCHNLHFYSLCILKATTYWAMKVQSLIRSEKLLNNYILKLVGSNLYLWW
ncbi:unnamed protein product [Rotaria sp. Silwood1]|nr:unnamed protein product [Rotaria sp. Silwood1]CAF1646853.1 unnamed protein product [Rotaria sp. Silwood1]